MPFARPGATGPRMGEGGPSIELGFGPGGSFGAAPISIEQLLR
jgi:hypothetical protein